jgi:hypothetical protein
VERAIVFCSFDLHVIGVLLYRKRLPVVECLDRLLAQSESAKPFAH